MHGRGQAPLAMLTTALTLTAAIAAALVLVVGVLFQMLLAAGQPLGRAAWGGSHRVLPPLLRVASAASAAVLAAAGWVVLARAGLIHPAAGMPIVRTATWVFAGVFALSALANLISTSADERRIMMPLALFLCVSFLVVAMS